MKTLPLTKAFMLLEPGPVILVTTADRGKRNVMTISWHMVMDFTPRFALLTGPWNYSYQALVKTRECVLALPTVDMARTVVEIGACSGADTDKFEKFGLTALAAQSVQAPLIGECRANVECRVAEHIKRHNIFVLDAIHAWVNDRRKERRTIHAKGDGTFIVDGRTLNYRRLMLSRLPPGV
jgi:flavin reductase (DIM6/NTAB) family NADH-FMN oxidoreductase RutF